MTCEEAEADVLAELKSSGIESQQSNDVEQPALPGKSQNTPDDYAPPRSRERCRQAARRLVARGTIVVTQDGKVVDPSFAKGVMELKLSY